MTAKLLDALDEDAVKILVATSGGAVPVATIRECFDIPRSTLYRRLAILVDLGVLSEEPRLDDANNEYFAYRANLARACVSVENGRGRVSIEFDDGRTRQDSFELPE